MLNDNEKDLNIVLLLQIDYFLLHRGTSKNISKISKFKSTNIFVVHPNWTKV
jgi:hypothetical protein